MVEYTLQYDKGDAPDASRGYDENNGEQLIREERPLEQPGLLVDGTHVVTPDMQLHPRFIKEIKVRRFTPEGKAEPAVGATISSYAKEQNALTLELAGAIVGSKPAVFDAKKTGPYSIVQYVQDEGRWIFKLLPFGGELAVIRGKSVIAEQPWFDRRSWTAWRWGFHRRPKCPPMAGRALSSWGGRRCRPTRWPNSLSTIEGQANQGIVRVMLNFRSPRGGGPASVEKYDGRAARELDRATGLVGVAVDAHTLLVLAELKPKVTARLDAAFASIPIHRWMRNSRGRCRTMGRVHRGRQTSPFEWRDRLFSGVNFLDLRSTALPSGEIYLQGEKRVAYFQPRRIDRFGIGWHGALYPQIFQDTTNLFLFDSEGKLLAVPLAARQGKGHKRLRAAAVWLP